MHRRDRRSTLVEIAFGAVAVVAALGVRATGRAEFPTAPATVGPVARAAVAYATAPAVRYVAPARSAAELRVDSALVALTPSVRTLSHPQALEDAVRSYFAYRAAHPESAANPYLYFVDYGLPSTTPRGYVFDMAARQVVEGPFTVAHGRGSAELSGVPQSFSNAFGSAATSLGLYVAQELYPFRGHMAGQTYTSLGMRLEGVSDGFNDLARARRVVAHGAPYVTDAKAGRSEGCPALEPARAERLLPKLANGGLVFLFAPDARWMAADPWVSSHSG